MSATKAITKKTWFWAAGAMLAMFVLGPYANANPVRINFSGAPGSGYADLTLGNTDSADVVDPNKKPVTITDASGYFNGIKITGLEPLNYATPPPGEVLPASYSLFPIPKAQGGGDHDGVSYDNLFYPDGSPLICLINGTPVYPFSGGYLDLMGVMFALDNGNFLDLWSFGNTPPGFAGPTWPGGLLYGMKLIEPFEGGGYQVLAVLPFASVKVPEPNFLWLFGAGVLGLLVWRRSIESRKLPRTR